MITIKKSTLMIISIIIIIILSLSIGFNAKAASSSTTINSHGRLELNNSSGGGTIVLDAQDIQDNANNISTLNSNLTSNYAKKMSGTYDTDKSYVTVDSIGYDADNNKLCLKVNGADTVIPFSSGSIKRVLIGSGANGTYSATSVPNYQDLTTENFAFVPTSVRRTDSHWGNPETYNGSHPANPTYVDNSSTCSMIYDPVSGILTVSGLKHSNSVGESGGDAYVYGNFYCYYIE